MNCLSWNCRSLGKARTVRVLNDLIKDRNPDVVFLIETISQANKIEELRIKLGYSQCFAVDCVGRSGGLAMMCKETENCIITGYPQHHVDIVFLENNVLKWILSCFYRYADRSQRKKIIGIDM